MAHVGEKLDLGGIGRLNVLLFHTVFLSGQPLLSSPCHKGIDGLSAVQYGFDPQPCGTRGQIDVRKIFVFAARKHRQRPLPARMGCL
ncbi:MAG: hypothetical protein QF583_08635, partial [Rhodospirillales bacterium]|nr:hypothetical protein [Rhodospirillales bacterium]